MFDDIILRPQEEELLAKLVLAEQATIDNPNPFVFAETSGGGILIHGGISSDDAQAYGGYLESLARYGLINRTMNESGSYHFDVSGKGIAYLERSSRETVHESPNASISVSSLLITDEQLRARVEDLLKAQEHFDRAIGQTGVLLEHRVRERTGAPATLVGVDLMTHAFRLKTGRLVVSDVDAEQEAVHQLFRGFIGFFKNPSSHRIISTYTREQASAVVGFGDLLLGILTAAKERAL